MDPVKTSMSSSEQGAFEKVSVACRDDVDRLCSASAVSFPFPFAPSRSTSLMQHHVSSILDEVMRSLMVPAEFPIGMEPPIRRETQEQEEEGPIVIRLFSGGDGGVLPCPHMFMEHVFTQFLPMVSSEEETNTLAEQISQHGQSLLESESVPEEHVHLARRLSEVTPEEVIAHRRAFLPFTGEQNDCLIWHAQQRRSSEVSPMCLASLNGLHQVRSFQYHKALERQQEDANIYANLFLMYAFVTATGVILYCRRKTRAVKPGQIIKAIYGSPHLKEAVEKEMGLSLGKAPPSLKGLRCAIATVRWGMVLILCLVVFDVLSVATAMSAGCIMAAYLFFRALLWTPGDEECCSCCCCEATPEDAAEGTLTEEQACCSCCQGTGVCGPNCCCCGGMEACREEENCAYKLLEEKDENMCCSASGSSSGGCCDMKKECCNVDVAAACCGCECCANGCCGGTGCCCCCTPKPTKTISHSRHEVWEGVPIQIV